MYFSLNFLLHCSKYCFTVVSDKSNTFTQTERVVEVQSYTRLVLVSLHERMLLTMKANNNNNW